MAKTNKSDIPYSSIKYEMAFYEAKSFLTAAEVIGKKVSALIAGQKADIDDIVSLQYVKYVNHSYAFELLLKCIMIIEDGHYFTGHNLLNLFKKLNPLTQTKIITRFDEYKSIRRNKTYFGIFEKIEFLTVLEEAGTAFMEFRYLFEGRPTPHYELDTALACLEYYIGIIKPELKKQ